jgi:phosphoglycolate phosphatase-like HAD superfamily hydrolase
VGVNLIVSDWSGVISDDRRPVYEANMALLEEFSKPRITFEEWLPQTTLTPIEFLKNKGIYEDPEELFAKYKVYLDEAIKSGIVPIIYPDIEDVFKYVIDKEIEIVILSSHPEENLINEAEQYGLSTYLRRVLGNSKDKTKGLLLICGELEVGCMDTLYLGDTVYDIRAAKEAGVQSGGVCTGYHEKERLAKEEPTFLLDYMSDLKKII